MWCALWNSCYKVKREKSWRRTSERESALFEEAAARVRELQRVRAEQLGAQRGGHVGPRRARWPRQVRERRVEQTRRRRQRDLALERVQPLAALQTLELSVQALYEHEKTTQVHLQLL